MSRWWWLGLANKTAIVTGAGSGIGAAVTKALSIEDCRVILADYDESALRSAQRECGPNAQSISTCDISKEDQVGGQLFKTISQENHLGAESSILNNCAGITRDGWIGKMGLVSQWRSVLDVDLIGTFLCCREFLNQD